MLEFEFDDEDEDLDDNNVEAILDAVTTHNYEKFQREFDIARAAGADAVLFELVSIFDIDGNTLLHRCAVGSAVSGNIPGSEGGGERIAEFLLTSKAAVNAINLLGESPLLAAARASAVSLGVVATLLTARADPGCADTLSGETALMEAACSGNVEFCRLLLEAKADPHQQNLDGLTAGDLLSMDGGGEDAIMELLGIVNDKSAEDDGAVGDVANDDPGEMREAGDVGEEVDGEEAAVDAGESAADVAGARGTSLAGDGATPATASSAARKPLSLRAAVKANDVEAVGAALASLGENAGAALDTADVKGRTLLHICAASPGKDSSAEIARLLLEGMARVEVQDAVGQEPLALAVSEGLAEQGEGRTAALDLMRVLLVARANPAVADDLHYPLQVASETPAGAEICKLLQSFGAELYWWDPVSPRSGVEEQPDSPGVEEQPDSPGPEPLQSLRSRCEDKGISFEALGESAALGMLSELETWQGMSGKALRSKCETEEVPIDGCIEKSDFVRRLLQVRTWQVMPFESLKAVFKQAAPEGLLAGSLEGASREDLEDALMISKWGVPMGRHAQSPEEDDGHPDALQHDCREKGIPYEILEDQKQALDLLKKAEQLAKSSISDLKKEFKQLGLSLEAGMEKRDMVSKVLDVHIWEVIPVPELQKVCAERGVSTGTDATRKDLIRRLLGAAGPQQPRRTFVYQSPTGQSGAESPPSPQSPKEKKPSPKAAGYAGEQRAGASGGGAAFRANLEKAGVQQKERVPIGKPIPPHGSNAKPKSGPGPQASAPPRKGVPSLAQDYITLGLDSKAGQNDVRKAYRKLALQYHPDKNPGKLQEEASRKFRLVQEAYTRICEHLKPKPK